MGIKELWTGIAKWLDANAPATAKTIRTPAPEAHVRSVEESTPDGWPNNLSTLYRLFDGAEPSTAGYIFPNYRPLSLKEAEKTRQMLLEIWARVERKQTLPSKVNIRPLFI